MPKPRLKKSPLLSRKGAPFLRDGAFRRESAGWSRMTFPAAVRDVSLDRARQRRGPWRLWVGYIYEPASWVADIPSRVLNGDDGSERQTSVADWLRSCFAQDHSVDPAWTPPRESDLAEWLPPAARTIRFGRELRELTVVRKDRSLVLRIPLAPAFPADTRRRARANQLLFDWQRNVWMVRFVASEEVGLVAETDLTGVPAGAAEDLVRAAADCLRHATGPILPALGLLQDETVSLAGIESLWDASAEAGEKQPERSTQ
ncbi:MAG: hypothetical protein KJ726_09175 [Verrucomicrobia bacterium]|nr:hypothetical protein [Verrucomicrobiota bacterium]MBU1910208.1 hypothetical protein [Verrucomicrobiota bacterium]